MAFTSSKMGLRVWNLVTDLYDHTQLADNMMKTDQHDHTPGRGVQVPTEGIADGAITNTKLAAGLIPPNMETAFSSYKLIDERGAGVISNGNISAAGNYVLQPSGVTIGGSVVRSSLLYIDPADYQAGPRNPSFHTRFTLVTNAVAPGTNLNISLWSVTITNGASGFVNTFAANSLVGGTAEVTTPVANQSMSVVSSAFSVPTAGYYVPLVGAGAAIAANSRIDLGYQLFLAQV